VALLLDDGDGDALADGLAAAQTAVGSVGAAVAEAVLVVDGAAVVDLSLIHI
jgi:hypothetical protein